LPSCRVTGYTFLESLTATLFSSRWTMLARGTTFEPTILWSRKEKKKKRKRGKNWANFRRRTGSFILLGPLETSLLCGTHLGLSGPCYPAWARSEGQSVRQTLDQKKSRLQGSTRSDTTDHKTHHQPQWLISWNSVKGLRKRISSLFPFHFYFLLLFLLSLLTSRSGRTCSILSSSCADCETTSVMSNRSSRMVESTLSSWKRFNLARWRSCASL